MRTASIALLCSSATLAAAGQILLKRGAHGHERLAEFLNPSLGAGLLCYLAGTVLWIAVLSRESLVSTYAFTALSFVLVYGASVVVLGESVTASAGLGVICVLVGLYLIATQAA